MAKNGLLRVWGQHENACVEQRIHNSSVQDMKVLPVVVNAWNVVVWGGVVLIIGAVLGAVLTRLMTRGGRRSRGGT